MNTSDTSSTSSVNPFFRACASSCQELVSKIQGIKRSLLAEFRQKLNAHDKMLPLALNEAEALAYETDFPLLVFPTLAQEKAEAIAAWRSHQQALLASSFERLAA
jgi:hypothetical protein